MAVYRPPFIKQLDGSAYAGFNCTCASTAMAIVRHRRGSNPPGTAPWYPTPRYIRSATGDYSGGTNLDQNRRVAYNKYGVALTIKYKHPWSYFRSYIKSGRGAVLQGGYDVIRATKYSGSSTFYGNHAVYVNQVRYNTTYKRYEYLVGDPLCDGRRTGIPKGYQWMPESLLKSFAGRLLVGSYRLGIGYVYAMYTKVTESTTTTTTTSTTITLRYGAHVSPPRKLYAHSVTGLSTRYSPSMNARKGMYYSPNKFIMYRRQTTTGESVSGSNVWYGNTDGTRWVPRGRIHF